MKHEEAWNRLPDLLDDRDDSALLAHVAACAECQRQLFLLGRIDRLLRDRAAAGGTKPIRWVIAHRIAASAAVLAVTAAALLVLLVGQPAHTHDLMLRTASGEAVGRAAMSHADAHNVVLTLTAWSLPINRGDVFVLWARDNTRGPMQVGRFMVDRSGGCRVRFNLPATHTWGRFWITGPDTPAASVAST
jgi:hypothetical protein